MGGGSRSGGDIEMLTQGVTMENLGDLFVLKASDLMRRYDQDQPHVESLLKRAEYNDRLAESYDKEVAKRVNNRLQERDIAEYEVLSDDLPDSWGKLAISSLAFRSLAKKLREEIGAARTKFDRENSALERVMYSYPKVRVEDISDEGDRIQRFKRSNGAKIPNNGKYPPVVEGQIKEARLFHPNYGNVIEVSDTSFWRWRDYVIGPIIDRDNDYSAAVKITFIGK